MSVYFSGEVASWYLPHARRAARRRIARPKTVGGEFRAEESLNAILRRVGIDCDVLLLFSDGWSV